MTELIKSYLETAKILKQRIDEISEMMKTETDLQNHKSLKARKETLEDERYDMLGVVVEMLEHSDEKSAHTQRIAMSGDFVG